jgi:hypothetical protein
MTTLNSHNDNGLKREEEYWSWQQQIGHEALAIDGWTWGLY